MPACLIQQAHLPQTNYTVANSQNKWSKWNFKKSNRFSLQAPQLLKICILTTFAFKWLKNIVTFDQILI